MVPCRHQEVSPCNQHRASDHGVHTNLGQSYQSEVAYVELLRQSSLPLGLVIKGKSPSLGHTFSKFSSC